MSDTTGINLDELVDKYVRLRDKKRDIEHRHKEELKPYNEALDKLEEIFLSHLTATHQERAGTLHGTVYKSTKDSVSIADKEVFWQFVTAQGDPRDFVDIKANVNAVRDYMRDSKSPVPGVNFSSRLAVGVLRSNGK